MAFCVLCRVPIGSAWPENEDDEDMRVFNPKYIQEPDANWTKTYRPFYKADDDDDDDGEDELGEPTDSTEALEAFEGELPIDVDGRSVYPFHAACYSLLVDINGCPPPLKSLGKLFSKMEAEAGYPPEIPWGKEEQYPYEHYWDTEHGWLGSTRYFSESGGRMTFRDGEGNEYKVEPTMEDILNDGAMLKDPSDLSAFYELCKAPPRLAGKVPTAVQDGGSGGDLQKLPNELWNEIFWGLSAKDVMNLRLASRTAASVPLLTTYWRSRFEGPHEMRHLPWQRPEGDDVDWPKLLKELRNPKTCGCLENRRTLWELNERLVKMMKSGSGGSDADGDGDEDVGEDDGEDD